ncbi:MAG: UvrD-helicase domain-containing protein [Proteobacteria bacterium]|nr:UvrD-helicase domain-containing protein [Pseudomonadota bacterium]
MLDLKNDLNEQQYEAVSHVHGPLLVLAGAGSGKTRVITYRVTNLVENCGVKPWRVLAVTFTNKAAREMQERIGRLLNIRGADCWVSTFHSTCAKFLRLHGELAGIDSKFTIYDEADQKAMVIRCLKELGFDDKGFPPRQIIGEINRSKRELVSAEDYPQSGFYRERVQKIYALYEKRMRDACALDFGDLLYCTVRGMQQSQAFFDAISGRFDYILVDEFQDTNQVQLELIRILVKPHGNICVVGDDDQSIYSWRGANVANILEFERFFPGVTVVTLERNYRSTANILKAAHTVVDRLPGRHPKELWTESSGGEPIAFIEAKDERDEARLVARAINELKDDGYALREQAVFYRINAQSRVFEEVFRTLDIPHRVVGGMRFYERAEVKDMLAYLRLVQNPGDLAAFIRVVNTPTRGIGKTTIDKLTALAAELGISAYDAIDRAASRISSSGVKRLVAFQGLIEGWRAEIDHGPSHLAARVLDDTGYLAGLQAEDRADSDARIENLKELIGSIQDFEKEAESPTLSNFLELIVLQSDVDAANFDGEQVTLMTVHSAKGLEFDVVHVTGLEEDLFPYRPSNNDFTTTHEAEMEEERRLCYVAMTRARARLFLTRARTRRLFGRERTEPHSRFLNDIPQELLIDLTQNRPSVQALETFGTDPSERHTSERTAPSPRPTSNETWIDRSFDQSPEGLSVHPGQRVRNVRYGVGEVVAIRPGSRPKVEVLFPGFGKKVIIIDYLEFD